MKTRKIPDIDVLEKLLFCDFETGSLLWKNRPNARKNWNSNYAGKPAFTYKGNAGYFSGSINCVNFLAHRIIYKMAYNQEPKEIDHIDGNRQNNKLSNLRGSNKSTNQMNAKKRDNCTSIYKGVYFNKRKKKYAARCNRKFIGYFENDYDAALAYNFMAHKEFGDYAKFNTQRKIS